MKPEHEVVVDLIREVGVGRLGNFDGCVCCHFEVRNVSVDVACGKGRNRGVWVSSGSLDYYDQEQNCLDESLLRPIADEVKRQIEDADGHMRGTIAAHCRAWCKSTDK